MPALSVIQLSKSFGRVEALCAVSFEVEKEQFLSLLGPSGCGKTTTLRLIAGFEHPDTGDVRIDERSILHEPPERRQIGFVFQNYALFPHMSVERNIAYGIRFHRGVDPRRRVAELLELVDLIGLERRRPAELSAGQRQRVALARALAPRPRILLLDEPLSALDAKLRESLRTQIRCIQRELALSTLYVTHDQEEALGLSDRVAVMNAGRIEQIATSQQIYEHPKTEFVASFIGGVNQLEGKVVALEEGRVQVRAGEAVFIVSTGGRQAAVGGRVAMGSRVGDRVTLFIKEECLRLNGNEENVIPARVVALEYRGESVIVHLESALGPLRARASVAEASVLQVDEQIEVSFSQSEGLLFLSS